MISDTKQTAGLLARSAAKIALGAGIGAFLTYCRYAKIEQQTEQRKDLEWQTKLDNTQQQLDSYKGLFRWRTLEEKHLADRVRIKLHLKPGEPLP